MAQDSRPDDTEENRNEQPEAERESQSKDQEERESIWTIPAKLKRWYFALFSIQVIVAALWLTGTAIADESRNGVPDILTYLWLNMAPVAVTSATFALVIVDTVNGIMVLSTWLEDELKKRRQRQIQTAVEKAVEKAVERTRDEEREAVRQFSKHLREWNERREAAAATGEHFDEPPPGFVPDEENH